MASMTGKQIKERLERDLGFEGNRARLLTEVAASTDISVYWAHKNLGKQDEKTYSALAKAALVSGVAGRQKLGDLIHKLVESNLDDIDLSDVVNDLGALVADHQKTLNLSRNRASCVNAHLNVLEPDRSLQQVYSPYLSADDLKKVVARSNNLLKIDVANGSDFLRWINSTHELLAEVSNEEQTESSNEEFEEGAGKKGLISRRAISTYLKQWELFAREKLGPNFSIEVREIDASPLTGKLNVLENGASRTWTTMLSDITEMKTSTVFQKRTTSLYEKGALSTALKNVASYDLEINGKVLKIQLSNGVTETLISQFVKAMKAQFIVYSGKSEFTVTLQSGNETITVSLHSPDKNELKKIEEILLQLI